jgi:AcrR family transcriptional regulator
MRKMARKTGLQKAGMKQKTRMNRGEKRPVAGREEILSTARAIGERQGWAGVTIRSVARELGYTSPLLYEHFRNKEDLLTQIAVKAIAQLEKDLTEKLPADSQAALLTMAERYWRFMLEHKQLYRLMNGMDGVPIDNNTVGTSSQSLCKVIAGAVRPLAGKSATQADALMLADELWALLHGMAALYLDRSAPFDTKRVVNSALRLVSGATITASQTAS